MTMHMKSRCVVSQKDSRFYLKSSYFADGIPFVVAMKAMGCTSEQQIASLVGIEPEIMDLLGPFETVLCIGAACLLPVLAAEFSMPPLPCCALMILNNMAFCYRPAAGPSFTEAAELEIFTELQALRYMGKKAARREYSSFQRKAKSPEDEALYVARTHMFLLLCFASRLPAELLLD